MSPLKPACHSRFSLHDFIPPGTLPHIDLPFPGLGRVQGCLEMLIEDVCPALVLRGGDRTWMSSTGLGVVGGQPVLNQIDDKSAGWRFRLFD